MLWFSGMSLQALLVCWGAGKHHEDACVPEFSSSRAAVCRVGLALLRARSARPDYGPTFTPLARELLALADFCVVPTVRGVSVGAVMCIPLNAKINKNVTTSKATS